MRKKVVGTVGTNAGRTEDHGDGDDAGERDEGGAGHPAGEFRRRAAAAARDRRPGARVSIRMPIPRWPPTSWRAAGAMRPSATDDIQPDRANTAGEAVMAMTRHCSRRHGAAPDEWGTIGVWSWGVSRIIDYLETDRAVDAKRDRGVRPFASRQDGAVGVGEGRTDCRRVLELFGRDGRGAGAPRLGRDGRRHGAEFPVAVCRRRCSSGPAAGTTCRSTRTC